MESGAGSQENGNSQGSSSTGNTSRPSSNNGSGKNTVQSSSLEVSVGKTVTFRDSSGETLSQTVVTENSKITNPNIPEKEGQEFMGWKASTDDDGNVILIAYYEDSEGNPVDTDESVTTETNPNGTNDGMENNENSEESENTETPEGEKSSAGNTLKKYALPVAGGVAALVAAGASVAYAVSKKKSDDSNDFDDEDDEDDDDEDEDDDDESEYDDDEEDDVDLEKKGHITILFWEKDKGNQRRRRKKRGILPLFFIFCIIHPFFFDILRRLVFFVRNTCLPLLFFCSIPLPLEAALIVLQNLYPYLYCLFSFFHLVSCYLFFSFFVVSKS